jgi:tRNA isopentenyl-2-thiomethyl-A-37 hydroxylase MiaE
VGYLDGELTLYKPWSCASMRRSLLSRSGRGVARGCATVLLATSMSAGNSAEPKWVKLQTPRFGLVSQLDEDDTREPHTLIDAQLADAAITGRARTFAERTAAVLHELERLYTAIDAARSGRLEEARSLVTELLGDSSITTFGRREAERLLQQLEK